MASVTVDKISETSRIPQPREEMDLLMIHFILPLILTLLFLQAFRAFIGQIYFQNLGAMSLGPTVLFVFLLLSPVAILPLRKVRIQILMFMTVLGIILFRLTMSFIPPVSILYLVSTGLVVAFYGMYLPIVVTVRNISKSKPGLPGSLLLSLAISLAIAADLTLRAIGITWDVSTGPFGFVIAPILCILATIAAYMSYVIPRSGLSIGEDMVHTTSKMKVSAIGLGFGGVFFAVLIFLAYPNVIARWTVSSYELATISIIVGLVAYALMTVNSATSQLLVRKEVVLILNILALLTAIDLAYLLSPIAGILAGITILAFMLDLRLFWNYLESHNATLTGSVVFHFTGMLILLLFTLFYVLTLVAGMILSALEGLSPYLILISFILVILPSIVLVTRRKEVVA